MYSGSQSQSNWKRSRSAPKTVVLQLLVQLLQRTPTVVDGLMNLVAEVADKGGIEAVAQAGELLLLGQQHVVAQAVVQVVELLMQRADMAEERQAVQLRRGIGEYLIGGLGLLVVVLDGALQVGDLTVQAAGQCLRVGDKVELAAALLQHGVELLQARLRVEARHLSSRIQQVLFGVVAGIEQGVALVGKVGNALADADLFFLQAAELYVQVLAVQFQLAVAQGNALLLRFQIVVGAQVERFQLLLYLAQLALAVEQLAGAGGVIERGNLA
ncbi:hypothetical protein UMZ34_11945 [Halopseudomonas pachastrellae]|nr:hypothetical protein UMZ34_11945 [Halopseudomonas pachastrellae]